MKITGEINVAIGYNVSPLCLVRDLNNENLIIKNKNMNLKLKLRVAQNPCYKHTTKVMDLEGRKNNTYFDQTGKQILVGDLLKVFHFRSNNRNYYMYQTVVMEETEPFSVMSIRAHFNDKPHCRMYVVANNEHRAYLDAKVISVKDFETKRQKVKIK